MRLAIAWDLGYCNVAKQLESLNGCVTVERSGLNGLFHNQRLYDALGH